MAATTVAINTPEKPSGAVDFEFDIKSGATLKVGAMANLDANGELTDAADTASELCAGNVQSINAAGTKAIIRRGVHRYAINSTNITKANLFTNATVKDNQTLSVAGTTTNDVVAGKIVGVDSEGAWVDHRTA